MGYPLIENTTKIVASFDGFEFTSSGKVIKDEGFSKYPKNTNQKSEDAVLCLDVSIGDALSIENKEIKENLSTTEHLLKIRS